MSGRLHRPSTKISVSLIACHSAYSGTRAEFNSRAAASAFENHHTNPQLMVRTRLSAADILHRGVVLSLIGVCVWGIGTGILVHRDTLRMGRGTHIPHLFRFSPVDSDHNLLWILFFFNGRSFRGKVF